MNLSDLFDPAGHWPFILGSYAVTFMVLAINTIAPLLRARRLRREIRNEIRARRAAR